jgi:hypothetical protein
MLTRQEFGLFPEHERALVVLDGLRLPVPHLEVRQPLAVLELHARVGRRFDQRLSFGALEIASISSLPLAVPEDFGDEIGVQIRRAVTPLGSAFAASSP